MHGKSGLEKATKIIETSQLIISIGCSAALGVWVVGSGCLLLALDGFEFSCGGGGSRILMFTIIFICKVM